MRRKFRWRSARSILGLLSLAWFGCFRGEFLEGVPCSSDDDCGPQVLCVDAVCGGNVFGSGGGSSDGGVEPGCGNGILDPGEQCDEGVESATCDFDCTEVSCGDGVINAASGEQCEAEDRGGSTCQSLGFYGGELSCSVECAYETIGHCYDAPAAPVLTLALSQIKRFDFSWVPVLGAEYYQLFESREPEEPFEPIGEAMLTGDSTSSSMPLHLLPDARYMLQACNGAGCTSSESVGVADSLVGAVGYVKASNTDREDRFGNSVALSDDGRTLAVGAFWEDGSASGVDGEPLEQPSPRSGAVYVFTRDEIGAWIQQAYIKASNSDSEDYFGSSVVLSADGRILAVGAPLEDSCAQGVAGPETNELDCSNSGAVYVFERTVSSWSQRAYIKASNTGASDYFGESIALSDDGRTLAVGAHREDSNSADNEGSNFLVNAGAAYVFAQDGRGIWSQRAFLKASAPDAGDFFGKSIALSGDGRTLAVGAILRGPGGNVSVFVREEAGTWPLRDQVTASNSSDDARFGRSVALSDDGATLVVGAPWADTAGLLQEAGAAYVFTRDRLDQWAEQVVLDASNAEQGDEFGISVALGSDGRTLVVGAQSEDSVALGLDGIPSDPYGNGVDSGAAYVFVRDGTEGWAQRSYVKASNTGADQFGTSLALDGSGDTLAVGAWREDSGAVGIGGDQDNDDAPGAGAVYLY
ncbi:MAG: FG-GAP repeat protein [Myxococcota bacterium]